MADATRRSPSRAAYPAGSHQPRQRQQLATSSTPAAAAACAAVAATAASSSAAPAGGGAGSRSGPPATGPVVRGGTSSDAAHDVRGEGGGRQTMVVDDSAPRYGDGGGATRQSSGVGGGVHGAMAASAAGGVASAPAGEAPPSGDAPSDRSPDKMANLEVTLRGLEFPNLGDANGDATWDNAVEMVKAAVGDGFELRRLNKTRLYSKQAAAAATRPNRWNYVVLECEKGGLPKQNDRVADVSARRKTSSKKVGCKFKVGLWWPMEGAAPKLAQGVYLMHHTPDSGGREHERPRSLENNHELSREEVEGQAELISRLHFAGVKTTEIHKAVQDKAVQGVCKRLGLAGAQRVRSIRRKLDQQKDAGGKGQGGGSGELGQQAGAEAGDGDRVGVARRPRILLCLSGSVAAVKAPQLAVLLWEFAEVKILVTEASKHFLDRSKVYNSEAYANFTALDPAISVLGDADEWGAWDAVGDPVLHIQLRDWADMLLVAPLSANTLAKLANGLCDNLVTCVARAWDFRNKKSFLVAPAMNTHMWEHPMTARHLHALKEMGVVVVPPASKRLACGDTGVGALADVEEIQEVARRFVDKAPQR